MGLGWFFIISNLLKGKGSLLHFYEYGFKLIKTNPLPSYLSAIILAMAFTIVNLNMKLHILTREEKVEGVGVTECTVNGNGKIYPLPLGPPDDIPVVPKKEPVSPFDPPEIPVEKVIVPNLRKYAADKLNEISRSLEHEGG